MLWQHSLVDLKVYRLGGSTLLEHPSALYDVRLAGTPLPFTYPPFAAVVMVPFALLPWPIAVTVWTLGTVASVRGERLGSVGVCGVISLLCSPVSWSHHWVWIIPLGVALARLTNGWQRIAVASAWFGLFAAAPIWWPPRTGNQELRWTFLDHLAGNSYVWLSLIACAALAAHTWRTRQVPAVTRAATARR